jgi:hypothetical protein
VGAFIAYDVLNGSLLDWGADAGRGTISEEIETTTSANTANQVKATLVQPDNTVYRYIIRVVGRDTTTSGGYYGEWHETFERRAGNPTSRTSSPAVSSQDRWGTMSSSATFDVVASGANVVVRVSPQTANACNWTIIAERIRRD